MSDEPSMRDELDALARRLEEREAELKKLEEMLDRFEGQEKVVVEPSSEVAPGSEAEPPVLVQPAEPVVVRDPAVVELLQQSAGSVLRAEHLRVTVENLDKKVDTLARELHRWRAEDESRRQAPPPPVDPSRDRILRLAMMTAFLAIVVAVWALLAS